MEAAVLVVTHLSLMGIAFALGRYMGYNDAQLPRDRKGRFLRRED